MLLQANVLPFNIRVSVVEPGRTATGFGKSTVKGTLCDLDNPYEPKFSQSFEFVPSIEEGQDPKEVAQLVADILEEENPHFRYQTTERGKEIVGQILVDPTGDDWVDKHR